MALHHGRQQAAECVADVAQEQGTHALVKVPRLAATDRKHAHQLVMPQRHQGDRGNGFFTVRKQSEQVGQLITVEKEGEI